MTYLIKWVISQNVHTCFNGWTQEYCKYIFSLVGIYLIILDTDYNIILCAISRYIIYTISNFPHPIPIMCLFLNKILADRLIILLISTNLNLQ